MRSPHHDSIALPQPVDAVFQAVLGVVQNQKSFKVLAVHNGGGRLVGREKGKLSNPKIYNIRAEAQGAGTQLHVLVGTDPRSPKALLDGKANEKGLKKFLENVQGALDGSSPAPATPVADHFLQKKTEVPWVDPAQDPAIELDGNLLAIYGR